MTYFTNTDSVIDSRDIIERIEELEAEQAELVEQLSNGEITEADMVAFDEEEGKELDILRELAEAAASLSCDWEYGEPLIHRNYFEQYMDEMVDECYDIPRDLPYWMNIVLDYDALEQDYASVYFDGQEFLIRSV